MRVSTTQPASHDEQTVDVEARLTALERDIRTLTAAVDSASRLRISSLQIDPTVRIVGGKLVRRILEKGGLVQG